MKREIVKMVMTILEMMNCKRKNLYLYVFYVISTALKTMA